MASIQKRGENSWYLVVEIGRDARGKRRKRTKTIRVEDKQLLRTTKRLNDYLELELAKFQMEVEAGEYISPEKMKLEDFIKEWEKKYAKKSLAPLTLKTYKHHIDNHIIPAFGHMRLDQFKPFHIVSFLDDLSKPGARKDGKGDTLSSATIEYIYRVLRNIFNRAVDWQLITKHPMEGIKKPKVEKKEMKFYDQSELTQVISLLFNEPVLWKMFMLTAILSGCRRGEVIALEWSDVQEKGLAIKESISMTVNGEAVVKGTKNDKPRLISMPGWYMEELDAYRLQWKKEKLLIGDKWQGGDHEYVFHAGFGKPLYHTQPSKWWREFCQRHELRYIRFHDLRHSHVAVLIENETNLKAIQERLGHSTFQTTTDTYGHIAESVNQVTADKLEALDPRKKASSIGHQSSN